MHNIRLSCGIWIISVVHSQRAPRRESDSSGVIEVEPDNWYCSDWTDNCYIVDDNLRNFAKALAYCNTFESYLTSVATFRDNEDVADICGCNSCWIGLREYSESN